VVGVQDDAKEEEDMSVDSDEDPDTHPIPTTVVSQSKNIKPPPAKLRVNFCFHMLSGDSVVQVLFGIKRTFSRLLSSECKYTTLLHVLLMTIFHIKCPFPISFSQC